MSSAPKKGGAVDFKCGRCSAVISGGGKMSQHLLEKHKLPFYKTTAAISVNGKLQLTPRSEYAQEIKAPEGKTTKKNNGKKATAQTPLSSQDDRNSENSDDDNFDGGGADVDNSSQSSEVQIVNEDSNSTKEDEEEEIEILEERNDSEKCEECGETYVNKERHMERHGTALKCPFPPCTAGYKHKIGLVFHLKKMHGDKISKKFPCGEEGCSKIFLNLETLNKHRRKVHSGVDKTRTSQKYKCGECSEYFGNQGALTLHIKTHGTEFMCGYCSVGYNASNGLQKHERACHSAEINRPQQCGICKGVFPRRQSLEIHEKFCLQKQQDEIKRKEVAEMRRKASSSVKCGICSSILTNVESLEMHVKKMHPKQQFPVTSILLTDSAELKNTTTTTTTAGDCGDDDDVQIIGENLKVPAPPTITKTTYVLLPGIIRTISPKPQSLSLSSPIALAHPEDINLQKNTNSFKCEECHQTFSRLSGLDRHKKLHGTEVQCDYCPAGFKTAVSLLVHVRKSHPDIPKPKPAQNFPSSPSSSESEEEEDPQEKTNFTCPECHQIFSYSFTLNRHMKLHGTEVRCEHCTAGFKSVASLHVHLKKSHPDKPKSPTYNKRKKHQCQSPSSSSEEDIEDDPLENTLSNFCTECHQWFSSKHAYANHMKLHVTTQTIRCKHCKADFETVSSLHIHMQKSHPDNSDKPGNPRTYLNRTTKRATGLTCGECGDQFTTKFLLTKHQEEHGDVTMCNYCKSGFVDVRSLQKHLKNSGHGKILARKSSIREEEEELRDDEPMIDFPDEEEEDEEMVAEDPLYIPDASGYSCDNSDKQEEQQFFPEDEEEMELVKDEFIIYPDSPSQD